MFSVIVHDYCKDVNNKSTFKHRKSTYGFVLLAIFVFIKVFIES